QKHKDRGRSRERCAVDVDQLVVLGRRACAQLVVYSGCEGAPYPALRDEATRQKTAASLSNAIPGSAPWPVRREAGEIAWLLGAPFMVQVIEGAGDEVIHVLGGLADSGAEGLRLLDARWRVSVDVAADTLIASISGAPARQDFGDRARALAAAARVVKPEGRIVLLCRANPPLGPGAELLRHMDDPENALAQLRQQSLPDLAAAFQWASAAQHAALYL